MFLKINNTQARIHFAASDAVNYVASLAKIVTDYVLAFLSHIKKQFTYTVSLNVMRLEHIIFPNKDEWSTRIAPCLILGAIPLHQRGDLRILQNLGVNSILTLLEPFELEARAFSKPLTKNDYNSVGMAQSHIIAEDFKALSQEQIEQSVRIIDREVFLGRTIYVHCKAGRGRSATAIICFLLAKRVEGLSSVDEAIAYVKNKRSQISINARQKLAINTYFRSLPAIVKAS